MSDGASPVWRLRFGAFELDLESGELRRAGALVKLQPQPFKVLALLAGRAGRLVPREEIQQQVWTDDTFVDFDQGLNYCIRQIRAALCDDAETPGFIETCRAVDTVSWRRSRSSRRRRRRLWRLASCWRSSHSKT